MLITLHLCFVWLSEQTVTFALYMINRLVFYNRSGVFTARYALSPYIKKTSLFLKGLMARQSERYDTNALQIRHRMNRRVNSLRCWRQRPVTIISEEDHT